MVVQESQWHPWMRSAMELGRQMKTWFLVERGSEEDREWQAYFQKLGWTPSFVRSGSNPYTMPMQWPSHLPHDWEPLPRAIETRGTSPPSDF